MKVFAEIMEGFAAGIEWLCDRVGLPAELFGALVLAGYVLALMLAIPR